MTTVTGIGSWPGSDPLEAARTVLGELAPPVGLPHLVELPGRGPGADLVGRAAALLVELPVDLQPSGWRFVDHPGRDLERAASMRSADLDALAEAADGYAGPLKVQVCGPWTLSSEVHLGRGERSVVDRGARRDLVESLAEGVSVHLGHVRRLVPGAELVLQLDEPSLASVLRGGLRTQTGFGRLPAVEAAEVEQGLRVVLAAGRAAGATGTVVHCCSDDVPFASLQAAGADAVSVDLSLHSARSWESLAVSIESGVRLWAGVVPTGARVPATAEVVDAVRVPWQQVGLPAAGLADVVLTPACGLADRDATGARAVLARLVEAAGALDEVAAG
jgi:methionine synthase II (cobalamin-independent)